MVLSAGIDLHATNSVVVVLDEQDRVMYQKRWRNDLTEILQALAAYQGALQGVVVESTYNWYWLVDGLMAAGYRGHLAHTAAIAQYAGLKYTDDRSDARWWAHLLRVGVLKEGDIYPKAERAVRDLLRQRSPLVHQKTANVLSIENLLARNRGTTLSGKRIKQLAEAEVEGLLPNTELALAVQSNLAVLRCWEEQLKRVDHVGLVRVKLKEAFRPLLTVSGIGPILGMTIRLETGDSGRFASVGHFASSCRWVSSQKLSNGTRKGEGNTKNGNKYWAWAFVEAANFAVRYNARINRFYQRKPAQTKGVVAIKAVAHKLARACYYVLRDQGPFDVGKAVAWGTGPTKWLGQRAANRVGWHPPALIGHCPTLHSRPAGCGEETAPPMPWAPEGVAPHGSQWICCSFSWTRYGTDGFLGPQCGQGREG